MKIAIIKLGALGDVVRTLSILPAIKEKYPNSEITWITKKNALELFENNPHINNILAVPCEPFEEFDILYNFDIELEATELAMKIKARKKLGFYSKDDFPAAYNLGAEYYLNTLFDDDLKISNRKTYQEMMFQAAELEWKNQPYEIFLTEKDLEYSKKFSEKNKIQPGKLVGIHMGASSRWPSKVWHKDNLKEFIIKAKSKGYEIIVFGGPNEVDEINNLVSDLKQQNINILTNNPKNSTKEFASLVNLCNKMICSDSFALHISLALKKQTIGLFFCTSPHEVEGYGLLTKLASPILYDFFPHKSDQYSEELTKSIFADQVLEVLEK